MELVSVFFYLLLGIINTLDCVIRLGTVRIVKCFYAFVINEQANTACLAVPKHLAVVFLDDALINFRCITDIVLHSLDAGIERITFYDPWSIIADNKESLQAYLTPDKKQTYIDGRLSLVENDSQRVININFLGATHGLEGLVRACKVLCHSSTKVTRSSISDYLAHAENIYEPDLLIKIGPKRSFMAGYPPFSLRVTEFVETTGFHSRENVSVEEFNAVLRQFCTRDRRLGR